MIAWFGLIVRLWPVFRLCFELVIDMSLKYFRNGLKILMRMFLKGFTADLFYGLRNWRVVLPRLGDMTIFLGVQVQGLS